MLKMTTPGEEQLDLLNEPEIWLDLGCGQNPLKLMDQEGKVIREYEGVDEIDFGQKHVMDLRRPWPWKDGTIAGAYSSHFIEHLDGVERIHFMNELWRVLRLDAEATIVAPHWSSDRAYGDPTHKWPPISDMSHFYWFRAWREGGKMPDGNVVPAQAPHTGYKCDFDSVMAYIFNNHPTLVGRNSDFMMDGAVFKRNFVSDVRFTLTKRDRR